MRKPGDEIDSIELTRCADAILAFLNGWRGSSLPPWPADAKMTYEKDPFPTFDRETVIEATNMLMRMGEIQIRPTP